MVESLTRLGRRGKPNEFKGLAFKIEVLQGVLHTL